MIQEALGDVAQFGERIVRNDKVRGSIPLISTLVTLAENAGVFLCLIVKRLKY